MTTYKSRPGPYGKQQNGEAVSEELRRQSDIQMGQLIQEVKNIGLTLTSMKADIDALKTHMHTNKGFAKGFASGFPRGFQFAALLGAGSLGAAIVKAFDLVVGK